MPVDIECAVCGDVFSVPPSRSDAKYCSNECNGEAITRDEDRYEDVECGECGEVFEALKSKNRKYCSRQCNAKSREKAIEKSCEVCGEAFRVIAPRRDTARFCSYECMGEWQSNNRVGENHPNYKGTVKVKCEECDGYFDVPPSREDTATYCSQECMAKAYNGVNIADNPRKRVVVECDGCGVEFERQPNVADRGQDRQFCSKSCEAQHRPTGEDAHNWRGGYKWNYGPEWHEQIRKVRERDSYKCWLCGFPNGAHMATYDHGLETHHVEKYHNGGSNGLGNLLALCKYCHSRIE